MKTAIVTGGSSGIGKEIARGLAQREYRVLMAVRDQARGEEALRDIARTVPPAKLEIGIVDFARQESIRAYAANILANEKRIDVLVNNAGTWSSSKKKSPDGVELTWATNQLGYFLLTELLRQRLIESGPARIVSVASELARDLDLEDVGFDRRRYNGMSAYAQSKQANRMWTRAVARRLRGTGVTANSLHPGGVATGLFGKGGGVLAKVVGGVAAVMGRSPEKGAETAVWLASAPEVEGQTGTFFADLASKHCRFDNENEEERLFELCERMVAPNRKG